MATDDDDGTGGGSIRQLAAVGVVILVACIIAFFLLRNDRNGQNAGRKLGGGNRLNPEECEQLTGRLNEVVGYLEISQGNVDTRQVLTKADEALSELARKLPNEPAAVRNLAICRVLLFKKLEPHETSNNPTFAQSAIEAARRL